MNKEVIKAVVLGEQGVGKENVVEAMLGKAFIPKQATIGVEFTKISIKDEHIQFWTVSGNERFKPMMEVYCRAAKMVFLVYDVTSMKSFSKLPNLLAEVNKHTEDYKLFVIGNKVDIAATHREVPEQDAAEFARIHDATHIEVSAKDHTNINELLQAVTEALKPQNTGKNQSVDESLTAKTFKLKVDALRNYAGILDKLKNKEYFSSGPEKKSLAITALLAKPLTKDSLELVLKNENDPLIKNRNIFGNGFFRIKSKILGHTNPLRDGRACVSDTEWKLVQIYNALEQSKQDDALELSEDSQSSSAP